ncbi:hypothetical protein RhiXN_10205 [Rhizoctonia solani]|uniref:Transmembrane protein n=1 Tax=Rhizoctonia solani TaxID=456999 RepID=A0A8H8P188_9AGAM|nr:uncharacterized protein RhiXN_10205 [Rhizoctonia solani]QRW23881.1 hypothetical protein RhiXN_10205 [Rhizoctonia solani]
MPYNVTIDDISPLITYQGQWLDSYNLAADPYTDRYLGKTFHSSRTDGSQATFQFNGTDVWIFGAKRGNHGNFIVTIDNGQAQRIDGYAPRQPDGVDGVYQFPIFSRTGLSDGLHTVTLTNDNGGSTTRPFVDIDFITWTSNDDVGKNITIDDSDPAWSYTSSGQQWGTSSTYVVDYYQQTEHVTNVAGATASVQFEGNAVYLYGGTLDDHGTFNVQVNDHPAVSMNGSTVGYHPRVLLYYADGLGPGTHKLTVTNTNGGKYLDVDYVQVLQSSASEASESNPGGKAKTPIIAGTVCGVVIGLAWIIAAVWWFMRRRKRGEGVDLLNTEAKAYDVPPAGYGPASSGPGWDGQSSVPNNQPWANDPAYTGSYYQNPPSQTTYPMSMYPPSSVSGSGGGGESSTGAASAYGGTGRPEMHHQALSTLTQEDEADPRVHQMVPPPDPKGRAVLVVDTGSRGNMTEDELRASRMVVPERAQDWGPMSDTSGDENTGMLPPDYHQIAYLDLLFIKATEPFPNRRLPQPLS